MIDKTNLFRFLKIGVTLSVLTAIFMSYQIPTSFLKTFKSFFLILSFFGMILIMNYKSQKSIKIWNLVLSIAILILIVLTFFEK